MLSAYCLHGCFVIRALPYDAADEVRARGFGVLAAPLAPPCQLDILYILDILDAVRVCLFEDTSWSGKGGTSLDYAGWRQEKSSWELQLCCATSRHCAA